MSSPVSVANSFLPVAEDITTLPPGDAALTRQHEASAIGLPVSKSFLLDVIEERLVRNCALKKFLKK